MTSSTSHSEWVEVPAGTYQDTPQMPVPGRPVGVPPTVRLVCDEEGTISLSPVHEVDREWVEAFTCDEAGYIDLSALPAFGISSRMECDGQPGGWHGFDLCDHSPVLVVAPLPSPELTAEVERLRAQVAELESSTTLFLALGGARVLAAYDYASEFAELSEYGVPDELDEDGYPLDLFSVASEWLDRNAPAVEEVL